MSHCTCITCLPDTCTDGLMPTWKVEKPVKGSFVIHHEGPMRLVARAAPARMPFTSQERWGPGWSGVTKSLLTVAILGCVICIWIWWTHTLNPWMLWFCGFIYTVGMPSSHRTPGVGFDVCLTDRLRWIPTQHETWWDQQHCNFPIKGFMTRNTTLVSFSTVSELKSGLYF